MSEGAEALMPTIAAATTPAKPPAVTPPPFNPADNPTHQETQRMREEQTKEIKTRNRRSFLLGTVGVLAASALAVFNIHKRGQENQAISDRDQRIAEDAQESLAKASPENLRDYSITEEGVALRVAPYLDSPELGRLAQGTKVSKAIFMNGDNPIDDGEKQAKWLYGETPLGRGFFFAGYATPSPASP